MFSEFAFLFYPVGEAPSGTPHARTAEGGQPRWRAPAPPSVLMPTSHSKIGVGFGHQAQIVPVLRNQR